MLDLYAEARVTIWLVAADELVAVCDDPAAMDALETRVSKLVGKTTTLVRTQGYYLD